MKLHLGCGKRYIPGFVHVDIDSFPHIDYSCRIDRLPMFGDESAELIYCSHGLEYFDRAQALDALGEWCRILRIDGTLRIAVPDFSALCRVYASSGDLSTVLGPLYGRMVVSRAGEQRVIYHRTAYDYRSLEQLCRAAGFATVRLYDWRQTIHKDYDDYSQAYWPHMDKENGVLLSLNMEARK